MFNDIPLLRVVSILDVINEIRSLKLRIHKMVDILIGFPFLPVIHKVYRLNKVKVQCWGRIVNLKLGVERLITTGLDVLPVVLV